MREEKILVLGAGPAGLAFASRFGKGAIVLEKAGEVGGLSRSITIRDGVFDVGGHSFHTPHPEVLDLVQTLMAGKWHEQLRDARVWVGGQLLPYPFQRHFERLGDKGIVAECAGFQADPELVAQSRDFEEWIGHRFGAGVARHFMLPYNRKLWARDLKGINCQWVGERVAASGQPQPGPEPGPAPGRRPLQSESMVAYPAAGGFGAIFQALAARCHQIELNEQVLHIDLAARTLRTASGRIWPWEKIVSTMPLPELLASLSHCPPPLLAAANRLQAVSLKVLLLLARLRASAPPQRIYLPTPEPPPHKIAFNHTSSPHLLGRDNHAITCEISYSPNKPAPPSEELLAKTRAWLIAHGYINGAEDILAWEVIDVPHGYPVYCHARKEILAAILPFLGGSGIYSIGRFGSWNYANSDECIRQGLSLASSLIPRPSGDHHYHPCPD